MNTTFNTVPLKKELEEFLNNSTRREKISGVYTGGVIVISALAIMILLIRKAMPPLLARDINYAVASSAGKFAMRAGWHIIFVIGALVVATGVTLLLKIDILIEKQLLRPHRNVLGSLNGDQVLDKETVRRVCALKTDDQFKTSILGKMSFEQLKEARAILGAKQFKQLIDPYPLGPYTQVWKTIETIRILTNVDEITPHLNTLRSFKNCTWYLPCVKELDQGFKNRPIYQALRPHILAMSTTLEEIAVSFALPGCAPIVIKREILDKIGDAPIQLFGFGNRVWQRLGGELTVPREVIGNPEEYAAFSRIIGRYNGLTYTFRLDLFLRDAAFAHKYFNISMVEKEFDEGDVAPTLENYKILGDFYCQNLPGSTLKQKVMDKLAALFKASVHTHAERVAFAEEYGLQDQLIPSKEAFIERFNAQPTDETLFALYELCTQEELEEILSNNREQLCTLQRIKPLLDFCFAKRADAKGAACHRFFANYVKTLSRNEVVQIWGVNLTPPGVEVQFP